MSKAQINKVANNKKVYYGDNFLFAGEKKRGLVKVCWNHQGFYFDQSIVARRTSLCCVLLLSLFVLKVLLSGGHHCVVVCCCCCCCCVVVVVVVVVVVLFVNKVLLSGGHRAGEEGKGWRRKPCKSLAGEKYIV